MEAGYGLACVALAGTVACTGDAVKSDEAEGPAYTSANPLNDSGPDPCLTYYQGTPRATTPFSCPPDGTEWWITYHANDMESDGCDMGRTPRIQRFAWAHDGTPDFGIPVPTDSALAPPSGEPAPPMAGET